MSKRRKFPLPSGERIEVRGKEFLRILWEENR